MSQVPLFLGMHLVGWAVCMAIGPHRRPALCCALAFPVGLAVTVVLALAILVAGAPYRAWSLASAAAVVALACAVVLARRGVARETLRLAAIWTVAFAAGCAALSSTNLALMTFDSHQLVMLGRIVAADGALAPDTIGQLDEWGVFQVVAQSTALLTRQDWLYALPVVLGGSFVALFAVTLWHAVRRTAWVALVTAVLFTMSMTAYHLLYLHTNLSSALYLFGFAALFWLAEVEADASLSPIAFLCLTAFGLQRTEAPLFCLLFLAVTIGRSELPRRAITPWLALFAVVVGLWYEVLARRLPPGGDFLTPARCRLVWAALLAALVWWLACASKAVRQANRWLPALLAALSAALLAAAFATRTQHMFDSLRNWAWNLVMLPLWGQSWFGLAALLLLALTVRPPRFRQVFVVGVAVSFALILLLAWVRVPYREGLGDSANRMTIHFVPLLFYYLGIKLIYKEP